MITVEFLDDGILKKEWETACNYSLIEVKKGTKASLPTNKEKINNTDIFCFRIEGTHTYSFVVNSLFSTQSTKEDKKQRPMVYFLQMYAYNIVSIIKENDGIFTIKSFDGNSIKVKITLQDCSIFNDRLIPTN